MDRFFNTIKKGLVAMLFVVVGFAMTYVPQLPSSSVSEVEAGPTCAGPCASLIEQRVQSGLIAAGNVSQSIVAGVTSNLWLKENVLDGIGWAIAKSVVSGMVRSLINWVNSGFQGSPAFVSDLKGFLLNTADAAIGDFIQNKLGDVGSFICSPFRLDVQISVALQYAQGRAGQTAPTCTLSGIVGNIEGFIAGIDPGAGLSDWLEITSTPQTYTPYGAILNAEVEARARLINAQGQVLEEVSWGDGFLSQKICEAVQGSSNGSSCSISKPGRVIADQLNKALGAGQDALIQADEINELVAALLGQLANKALTGAAGLLGLSGGTGFTDSTYNSSYLNELQNQADQQVGDRQANNSGVDSITEQINLKTTYRNLLVDYRNAFQGYLDSAISPGLTVEELELENSTRALVTNLVSELNTEISDTSSDITTLTALAVEYNAADAERRVVILVEFSALDRIANNTIQTERDQLNPILNDLGLTLE